MTPEEKERLRLRSAAWYVANRERVRAAAKEKYWADPAAHAAVAKVSRERNKATLNARQNAKYAADPEKRKAARKRAAEWAQANRERRREIVAKWDKANRLACNVKDARRRAKEMKADGKFTKDDVLDILRLQRGRCAYFSHCGRSLKRGYHVDHIEAIAGQKPSNDRRNLQLLCPTCNRSKGARDPIEHAQRIGLLI